jgi:very-short-patch-repair endonuclease
MPPTKDVEPPKPQHPQFRNEHSKRLSARRDARDLLWHRLDGRQLGGYRFHRDLSIPPIEVDFVCLGRRLVVEVIVDEQPDAARMRWLEEAGYRTAIFHEQEVLQKTEAVLKVILRVLAERGRR